MTIKDSREVNYFRIGTFVIIGITILIIAILIFGSGLLFKKTIYMETYFNDTIQGLSEGSPVKYRGMDIGHVKKINFIEQEYGNHNIKSTHQQYIYVEMAITANFLASTSANDIQSIITKDIKKGLRAKLALQGLTGTAYIEVDFLNPKANPVLPIDWQPKHYYVPSATSTLTRFSDNVQYILDELRNVQFAKLFNNIERLAHSSNNVMIHTDKLLNKNSEKISETLTNLEKATENLNSLTRHAKTFPSQTIYGNPPPRLNPRQL